MKVTENVLDLVNEDENVEEEMILQKMEETSISSRTDFSRWGRKGKS